MFTFEFRYRMNFEWIYFVAFKKTKRSLEDVFRAYVTKDEEFDGQVDVRNRSQFDSKSITRSTIDTFVRFVYKESF